MVSRRADQRVTIEQVALTRMLCEPKQNTIEALSQLGDVRNLTTIGCQTGKRSSGNTTSSNAMGQSGPSYQTVPL